MTISEIKAANAARGFHFFERGTLKFFGSRVSSQTFGDVFITSEVDFHGRNRRYTVRRLNDRGAVDTIGEFRQYATLSDAVAAAKAVRS